MMMCTVGSTRCVKLRYVRDHLVRGLTYLLIFDLLECLPLEFFKFLVKMFKFLFLKGIHLILQLLHFLILLLTLSISFVFLLL